ncbi:hypothetical protein LUZ60_011249 [Juncus effusus]|nr:hypothetical protein LUZ60_011249 [Juncus effusus]
MDHLPRLGSSSSSNPISKKPRSSGSRRPRSTTDDLTATPHIEPIHQEPNKLPSEGHKRKELYLNTLPPSSNNKKRTGSGVSRSSEGSLAPAGYSAGSSESNKLRKVKLKVGGVTRTIHAKAGTEAGEGSGEKNKSKNEHWFSGTAQDNRTGSPTEPTRKSRRVPKRRSMDSDTDLVHHEPKHAATHKAAEFESPPDEFSKKRKLSKLNNSNSRGLSYEMDEDFVVMRNSNGNKRRGNNGNRGEVDLVNEEEILGEENEGKHLTSRQRAMQGKGGNGGENSVEFPNGLPPAPSRKKNDKLSEVEIQAKKAEAAQRRKMQVEKAAKEAEAEAIRKILGLDSDKKKEEKKQKEREEKENKAKSQTMASDVIKLVMGPTGTVVTFPDELGLPSIFNSKPSNYPPPREKCAGPSCKNPYKYRDSKSNLPLCSLQCYKAVQESAHALTC